MNKKINVNKNQFFKFNKHVKILKIEIHPKMIMISTFENKAHFKSFKNP
jgi:hypothetical protein